MNGLKKYKNKEKNIKKNLKSFVKLRNLQVILQEENHQKKKVNQKPKMKI